MDTGALTRTRLRVVDGVLYLEVGDESLPLPRGALDVVMRRFGKPLDERFEELPAEETLDLGEGITLSRFRFLRRYDVIACDYLAFRVPHEAPLCEMATSVTAALHHLARRSAEISS